MSNTYFLAPLLPPIQLGQKTKLEKGELEALLYSQLSEKDLNQFKLLQLRFVIEALRRHSSVVEYKADFIQEWLEKYESHALRMTHFHELLEAFYAFVEIKGCPFLKAYFKEERDLGDRFLPLRKGEKSHSIPDSFIKLYEKGPLSIEKGLIQYKICMIDEWIGLNVFSTDAILAYAAKYYLNEEALKWDHEKGEMLLDKLEKGTL